MYSMNKQQNNILLTKTYSMSVVFSSGSEDIECPVVLDKTIAILKSAFS